jgi:hypothetical protein
MFNQSHGLAVFPAGLTAGAGAAFAAGFAAAAGFSSSSNKKALTSLLSA